MLDDLDLNFAAEMQSAECGEMQTRFNQYLSYMTFCILMLETVKDPQKRQDVLEAVISQWERVEINEIEKLKESELVPLESHIPFEPHKEMIKTRESALEETKIKIRFALRGLNEEQ